MRRRLWISAAFALGLMAGGLTPPAPPAVAAGQPPAGGTGKTTDKLGDFTGKKSDKGEVRKPDPADAAVAAALANDPDVQVARAKVQLAEAELAKAKQGVVLRVMTLNAAIQDAKRAVAAQQERTAWAERLVRNGQMPQTQMLDERSKLESAQATLSKAEMELRLLTGTTGGGGPAGVGAAGDPNTAATLLAAEWLRRVEADNRSLTALALLNAYGAAKTPAVKGPIPDRIRAALDKPVKLGAKGETVTFEKAMEVFKAEAGLDVPVRGPGDLIKSPVVVSQGEEMTVGAWFQLFQDYSGATIYVRDYGLLFAMKPSAPPDAPTLTEFWKQKPPEKKAEPAPDPTKK